MTGRGERGAVVGMDIMTSVASEMQECMHGIIGM